MVKYISLCTYPLYCKWFLEVAAPLQTEAPWYSCAGSLQPDRTGHDGGGSLALELSLHSAHTSNNSLVQSRCCLCRRSSKVATKTIRTSGCCSVYDRCRRRCRCWCCCRAAAVAPGYENSALSHLNILPKYTGSEPPARVGKPDTPSLRRRRHSRLQGLSGYKNYESYEDGPNQNDQR